MKIVLLVWSGELIMNAIRAALQKDGHEVSVVDIYPERRFEDVLNDVEAAHPDFCFTHNFYVFDSWLEGGVSLEQSLKKMGIPVATWYWDSPRVSGYYRLVKRLSYGPYPDHILFFVVDKQHQQWLEERRIPTVYLPIGVREDFFRNPPEPSLKDRFNCEISYVGKPCEAVPGMTGDMGELWRQYIDTTYSHFCSLFQLSGVAAGLSEDMRKDQLKKVGNLIISFFRAPIFSSEECDLRTSECLLSAREQLVAAVYRDFELYITRVEFFYSWFQLHQLLVNLLEFDLSVFGGDHWSERLLRPFGFSKTSPFLTDQELAACFAFSQISFCHTKWPFRHGVHERPLMVLAAGGFPLADYRAGLADLFADGEIAVYQSDAELLEKVRYYLDHEEARLKMAEKGRRRVLKDHTYEERVKVIVRETKRHFNL